MRVLITGAAGTIGRDLRAGLRGRHELLRLLREAAEGNGRDRPPRRHGLRVARLRIQSWAERPTDARHLGSWLSPRDGVELVHRCLVAPGLGFAVVWGVSANTRSWLLQEDLGWLGWAPRDDD